MNNKTLILVGPLGYGKSSTGNYLLQDSVFTEGDDARPVTTSAKMSISNSGLKIVDCPGFCDPRDEIVLQREFIKNKTFFLNQVPISAFIFVVKFDQDKSNSFLEAAKMFVKSFGSRGLKSLMLLCIQSNPKRRFSNEDFRKILTQSDGYKYMLEKNENLSLPYCLWDNHREYQNQKEKFEQCLTYVQPFIELQMYYAIDMMEIEIQNYEEKKALRRAA